MGYIKIQLSDEVEKKFRHLAMQRFGYSKGALSAAAEKAISDWTYKQEQIEKVKDVAKRMKVKDPVSEIEGLLKHVKKTSIELKHEIRKIRAEQTLHYRKKQ